MCGGAGQCEETCSLRVWVPAEIVDGTRIRVAGAGDVHFPAVSAGDLILQVQIIEGC